MLFDAKQEVNDRAYELLTRDDGDVIESEFICECDDRRCVLVVTLTTDQFVGLRTTGRPVLAKGHTAR